MGQALTVIRGPLPWSGGNAERHRSRPSERGVPRVCAEDVRTSLYPVGLASVPSFLIRAAAPEYSGEDGTHLLGRRCSAQTASRSRIQPRWTSPSRLVSSSLAWSRHILSIAPVGTIPVSR